MRASGWMVSWLKSCDWVCAAVWGGKTSAVDGWECSWVLRFVITVEPEHWTDVDVVGCSAEGQGRQACSNTRTRRGRGAEMELITGRQVHPTGSHIVI